MATRQRAKTSKAKAPWKKPAPRGASHAHLTPAKKRAAKARARRAGRPYPNLVDNMRAAGTKPRKKKPSKTKASRQR